MSLFLFQQKIPFASVIGYLRVFEPGCQTPPDQWGKQHAQDVNVGDMLFVFEPIYSPWGDSSSGIGVAEGDSFNVSSIAIVHKSDNEDKFAYVINAESYELKDLAGFLSYQSQIAQGNGTGFYYAIVRPIEGLSQEVLRDLSDLDGFGSSGWRRDDNQPIDIVYAFLTAASWTVDIHPGTQPDIAQIGYGLFCDKEPAPGSNVPDLRQHVRPLSKEARRQGDAAAGPGITLEMPAPAVTPGGSFPKLPSFFTQGGKAGSKPSAPAAQQFGLGETETPPAPQHTPLASSEVSPWGTEDATTDAWSEVQTDPVNTRPQTQDTHPQEQAATPEPASSAPHLSLWGLDEEEPQPVRTLEMPLESESEAATEEYPAWRPQPGTELSAPPEPAAPPPLPSSYDVNTAPPPVPGAPVQQFSPPPLPTATVPSGEIPALPAEPPALPESVTPPTPPALPEPVTAHTPPAPITPPPPSTPPSPGAPTPPPAAADVPSLAELLGNIGRASSEPASTPTGRALRASNLGRGGSLSPLTPGTSAVPPPPGGTAAGASAQGGTAGGAQSAAANTSSAPQATTSSAPAPAPPAQPTQAAAATETARQQALDATQDLKLNIDFSQIAPLPPKKKKMEASDLPRVPKENLTVKSGVAGLVSKLEQQASKASSRLESQVDEIQNSLSEELTKVLANIGMAENRNVRNAQDLRAGLTERLDQAAADVSDELNSSAGRGAEKIKQQEKDGTSRLDEKHEYLRTALSNSFDEVRGRAEAIARTFEESLSGQDTAALERMKELSTKSTGDLETLHEHIDLLLSKSFENFKEKLETSNASITTTIEGRYSLFQGQLADLHQRCMSQLEELKTRSLVQLNKQFVVAQSDVRKLKAAALEENVMPRLRQHRDELRIITSEFQNKLSEDLDRKSEEKIAEFTPVLQEKKETLLGLFQETTAIKTAIEDQLRKRLQTVAEHLQQFVERSTQQATSACKDTEDQLAEIDRSVRALADPSSIESDLELLNERNDVLNRMDETTEKSKEEVLTTLRTNLAALEEKGKQLQEELISSMEEDAYRVRRASEQALHSIRETIREAFIAIQTAQDERMPM